LPTFNASQLDQMCGDHPVNDLQHRREQLGVHGEEIAL
jgi:hypothetical protein